MKSKMILTALLFLIMTGITTAQAPQGIPYQAVARDNGGNLISNQNISVRFNIHNGAIAGPVVYSETHSVSTNALGLFTLNVGEGTPVSGTFPAISWGSGSKFLQVELDPAGGSSYTSMGTTQMMSVPYALHAGTAASFNETDPQVSSTTSNQVPKWNGSTLMDGIITDNGNNIGVGTTTPPAKLAVQTNSAGAPFNNHELAWLLAPNMNPGTQTGFKLGRSNDNNNIFEMRFTNVAPGSSSNYASFGLYGSPATMAIDGNGNVGVGTITPSQKLDINGQVRIRGGAPAVGKILTSGSDGTATWELPAVQAEVDPQVNSVATHRVPRWDGTSLVDGIIADNGSNVGIGVNYPTARLELKQNGYNWYDGMQIKADANAWGLYTDAYGSDNFKIAFNSANKFTIHGTSGNIGIGSITPTQKLDIDGQVRIRGGAPAVGKILTSGADGTATWEIPALGADLSTASNGLTEVGDDIRLGGSLTQNTTITHGGFDINHMGGFIGIGNTDPRSELHISDGSPSLKTVNDIGAYGASLIITDDLIPRIYLEAANEVANEKLMSISNYLGGIRIGSLTDDGSNWVDENLFNVQKNGNVGIGMFTPTQKLDIDGQVRIRGGAPGVGKVLTSGADGTATWQTPAAASGSLHFMGSTSGSGNNPTGTNSFLSATITVVITSPTQKVHITASKAFGAAAFSGGANNLHLFLGYNTTGAASPVTNLGGGIFGIQCAQGTRSIQSLSSTITGLTPGTYHFGMTGNTTSLNWNSNEWSYVSVMVFN